MVYSENQVGNQLGRVRRTEAGDGIPTGRGSVSRSDRVAARIDVWWERIRVISDRDVVEIRSVSGRIRNLVESWVEVAEGPTIHLGCHGDHPRPLWRART